MTAADHFRWLAALRRLTSGLDWEMPPPQMQAWFEQLERYPIDAVEQAMRAAPAQSGRFKPTVGQVEQLAKKAIADAGPSASGGGHAPGISRNEDGVVVARWRCTFCEDTGFRAKVTETGEVLTHDEYVRRAQNFGPPREDGQPHYWMRRCECRLSGQRVVAS